MYLGGGAAQAQTMAQRAPNPQNQERLMERARQIMEAQGVDQSTALAIAEAQGEPQPQVRAPIAQTTARLIDSDRPGLSRNMMTEHDHMFQRIERDMNQMRNQMRQNVDNGGLSVAFTDQVTNEETPTQTPAQNTNLQSLFSPPREILFQGSWDNAKEFAKEANKWVLVNIQKDSEFLSYNLNRDLWSNEIVKDLISTTFVFFQHEDTDQEAQKFKSFYNPARFPHISIVDPFTGEQMREIELAPYQHDSSDLLAAFLEVTNNFLESNTLEGEKIKKMQRMMLNRNKEKHNENSQQKPQTSTNSGTTEPINTEQQIVTEGTAEVQVQDVDVQMLDDFESLEDEPAPGPNVAVVQFRLFGKKTIKRRFRKDQQVKDLFSFVRHEVEESRTKAFDLICYPQKSLAKVLDSTLVKERLVNTSVSAVFL